MSNIEKYIKDDNILNIYQFGSHVYGTASATSDHDYILVVKEYFEAPNPDIHVYTVANFKRGLDDNEIQMMECYFAPEEFILKNTHSFTFNVNLSNIRKSISTITSNSNVKAKKKLVISGDYDLRAGIKSYYHCIRILGFAIQILESGKIYNFKDYNYIYFDLDKMSETLQRQELWDAIYNKYHKLYLKVAKAFRELAPKSLSDYNNKVRLKDLLNKYDIYNDELESEIIEMFKLYN